MLKNLGHNIRVMREKKGITLNAYAKELGVSSGYLSQLETGKTETLPLSLLEMLQKELTILPLEITECDEVTMSRFSRIKQLFERLSKTNPDAAEYLLSSFEDGIDYILKTQE